MEKITKKGRPAKFNDVDELKKKIDEYFEKECVDTIVEINGEVLYDKFGNPIIKQHPPTISGLALFLGFVDRQSLYDYKNRKAFSCLIKKAITRIESYAENQLLTKDRNTGAIFWLKNHGWIDKNINEHQGKDGKDIKIIVSSEKDKQDIEDLANGDF